MGSLSIIHAQQQSRTYLTTPVQLTKWGSHIYTPDLAVNSGGFIHLSFWANDGTNDETWYATNTGNLYGNITLYQKIDDDVYPNYYGAAIALDSNGFVHIVWRESPSSLHIFYTNNIGGFQPTNVKEFSFGAQAVDIAVDRSNIVWIVFVNTTGVYVLNNVGGAFNPAVHITGTNGDEANPQIAANYYPHIVYEDSVSDKELFYTKNTGSGFTAPIQLTDDSFDDTEPCIAVDASEHVYIAYKYDWTITESYSYEIFYSYNLQTPYSITYDSYNQSSPSIAVDSQGVVYIVYEKDIGGGNENIFLKSSNDNFQSETALTSNPFSDLDPKIGIDGNNNIHVIWRGYDGATWNIFYNYGIQLPSPIPAFSVGLTLGVAASLSFLFAKRRRF